MKNKVIWESREHRARSNRLEPQKLLPGGRETAPLAVLLLRAIAPRPITLVDSRSKCGSGPANQEVSSFVSSSRICRPWWLDVGRWECWVPDLIGSDAESYSSWTSQRMFLDLNAGRETNVESRRRWSRPAQPTMCFFFSFLKASRQHTTRKIQTYSYTIQ